MADREKFRENLNYYLQKNNVLQKDLAEYVGAKTATVSGWTRGISYPRADAMEKIAMFFGVQTSQLVGKREDEIDNESLELSAGHPKSDRIRVLMQDISKLDPEDFDQLHDMFYLMFKKKLKEGDKDQ